MDEVYGNRSNLGNSVFEFDGEEKILLFLRRVIVFQALLNPLARILLYPSSMASLPRYMIVEDGSTFHVTWQCHNRDWLLKEVWAKRLYYSLLLKYKKKYEVQIHSYCLMSNHPHLTGTMSTLKQFSEFFRVVNSQFAKTINKNYDRRGQVVMDRFKSPQIQSEADLLKVMSYIDLNPYRASMVKHPKNYPFSSYGYYAYGNEDPLIDPPEAYLMLGRAPEERRRAYRDMIDYIIREEGLRKQNYSSTKFIGNPNWVIRKYRELKQELARKRSVRKIFEKKSTESPPSQF